MIDAINNLEIKVLFPVAIGAIAGLIGLLSFFIVAIKEIPQSNHRLINRLYCRFIGHTMAMEA